MHIFLDESYNLSDRSKPQFISVNGFMTVDVKKYWKRWREYRRKFSGKWRIHANDAVFQPLREKMFHLMEQSPDITALSVVQIISEIPVGAGSPYYRKGNLNFDKVYEDMLKALFERMHLGAYTEVTVTLDSRKMKGGIIGKQKLQEHILSYFAEYYPKVQVLFQIVPSATNVLIELADFISNTLYKYYSGQDTVGYDRLKGKTIILKNPLK